MTNEIVFDIETQNSFAEVDNDWKKLRISVVSIYSFATDRYQSFEEGELSALWPILERADRLIGYNSEHFDLPVLHNYYLGKLDQIPHLDILKMVKEALGFRLKLDDLAKSTLDNVQKSADGLQAIRWFKEGKLAEIKKYCEQDVRITKEIYDFGRANRQLFYKNFKGEDVPFAVNFDLTSVKPAKINLTLPL